ncbi:MAG: hypothetical protein GY841_01510, partial [FCB group bacterium]|nr:hypothetical protein [FCB group bacterium]
MPDLLLQKTILNSFASSAPFGKVSQLIDRAFATPKENDTGTRHEPTMPLAGLAGGSAAFLLASLWNRYDGNIIFVTSNHDEGQGLADDLINIVGEKAVQFFPARQVEPYRFRSPLGEITGRRLATLSALCSPQKSIVVVPVQAVIEPTMDREIFLAESLLLAVGQEIEPENLAARLVKIGFSRVVAVEEVGDFAVRGGLIDFFSPAAEYPVRAEFFGDEIESLRHFDVRTQRTVERCDSIQLLPRREIPIRSETIENHLEKLHQVDADLVRARFISEPNLPGLEWLAIKFGIPQGSLLDYLSPQDIVVLDGGKSLHDEMGEQFENGKALYARAIERFVSPPEMEKYYFDPDSQYERLSSGITLDILPFRSQRQDLIDFGCKEHPAVGSRLDYLSELVSEFNFKKYRTFVTCDNKGQASRLGDILVEKDIQVAVEVFHIHSGFVSDHLKIALLTDHQIFSRRFRRIKRRRYREGVALTSYTNLNPGDIVVHADYGLARFSRLESITVDGRTRDCLLLFYKDGDKLFVPIEEFNRVSKYAGKDATPSLTSLGGPSW